jgi:undecaprenyl pyrophosphate phosphatase UppP
MPENALCHGYMFAFVFILIIVAERIHIERSAIYYLIAIAIGIGQAVALAPGTSRSGATIPMGMPMGSRKSEAVNFSLMYPSRSSSALRYMK